mmetsp:Transcript_757/g.1600  ORF Transcript_757/g.1600 Transcript_757/m.1600 type:complete len:362 (+) Transcript_757:326-1411(+)|eukprot:CAMPEP_0114242010 /NCGR_PEP_ID=MMETSP0058-20121206/9938_1 /TAXON_ID=36894 /ORGANISM="Pyramimonas parkeae, CCMP726" /LENGTH=361 /DNA_ID=CAMNT_0001354575 /DNA_START=312 /DNA_END=1397 /DNA_ORIENTATION=+
MTSNPSYQQTSPTLLPYAALWCGNSVHSRLPSSSKLQRLGEHGSTIFAMLAFIVLLAFVVGRIFAPLGVDQLPFGPSGKIPLLERLFMGSALRSISTDDEEGGQLHCQQLVQFNEQQVMLIEQRQVHAQGGLCMRFDSGFPSTGGPGCPCPCVGDNTSLSVDFAKVTWPPELLARLRNSLEVLQRYIDAAPKMHHIKKNFIADVDATSHSLHMQVHPMCCMPPQQAASSILHELAHWRWPSAVHVSFDRMVCAITKNDGSVSIGLRASADSAKAVNSLAVDLERKLKSRYHLLPHVRVHPQILHMTLAVMPAHMPCRRIVDEINERIPPGSWHTRPIHLANPPTCEKCHMYATLFTPFPQD